VVIPDAQGYSEFYPDRFLQQTRWIVAQQKTLKKRKKVLEETEKVVRDSRGNL